MFLTKKMNKTNRSTIVEIRNNLKYIHLRYLQTTKRSKRRDNVTRREIIFIYISSMPSNSSLLY